MELTKNKLFIGILAFMLLIDTLVAFDLQLLYLRAILSFIFIIIVPGLLIMLMMKIRQLGFWEYLIYTVGLSISFIMFAGLAVNWILPWIHITDKPLSTWPILICFNIFILAFWIIAYLRNKDLKPFQVQPPKLDVLNTIMFTIPIFFLILAILGAFILNNRGPNILTMMMLGSIAVYVFVIVLFQKRLNPNIYPWALLLIAISLILAVSLRSWNISGWDISLEYQMFQLTKENFYWNIFDFQHSYNACLSITILPTIFSLFLKINNVYIFKIIYPLMLALVPVSIYLLSKRYTKPIIAFMASFFFVSQWLFFIEMPTLARQEIAFLFFTLSLLILFNKNISPKIINLLFLLFGFSMVIGHYSTSYVALALFIGTYIIFLIFRKTKEKRVFSYVYNKLNLTEKKKRREEKKRKRENHRLSAVLIFLLLIFAFFWYVQFTETSDDLVNTLSITAKNLGKIFTGEMRSNRVELALKGKSNIRGYSTENIKEYIGISTEYHKENYKITGYTDNEINGTYKPRVLGKEYISYKNLTIRKIADYIYFIDKYAIMLFIVLGIFCLVFFKLKQKSKIDAEYIFLSITCVFFVVAMLFLPYLSKAYNFERLFQQTLIILSLATVLGGLFIFKFVKRNIGLIIVIIVFLFYFLYNSGILYLLIGGFPFLHLHNLGPEYDAHYTHESEVKTIQWLELNYDRNELLYADVYSELKIYTASQLNKNIVTFIFPSTIDRDAYVYSSYTNTVKEKGAIVDNKYFTGEVADYNFPIKFLEQNKNKIYSNGGSEFYK